MKIIGLTGVAGSGKSTVAEYLVNEHGFNRLSFAAPLKKMLRTLNPIMGSQLVFAAGTHSARPITLDDVFTNHYESEQGVKDGYYGDEYRRLLQVLGTDCIRAMDEGFWCRAALAQLTDPQGLYVFDDVRFPNEATAIEELSPMGLWHVNRTGYSAVNGHVSEQYAGCMEEALIISNNAGLDTLHAALDEALDYL